MVDRLDDPKECIKLGLNLQDAGYAAYRTQIIATVASSPVSAAYAGTLWTTRFYLDADKLVPAVVKDSFACMFAVLDWSNARFDLHKEPIMEKLLQSPKHSFEVGHHASVERVEPYLEKLADVISTSECYSYEAGLKWRAFFNPYMAPIGKVLHGTRYELYALCNWEESRRKHLSRELPERTLVLQALHIAESREATQEFYLGLEACLEAGTVKPWAQHIIEQFKPEGIGGGNYREVFR
jgi:hypothetical protein